MAQPSTTYAPGDPTTTVLYGIVREHFETFRAHAAALRDGDGLPTFVEQEFRDFLRCGAGHRDLLERVCRYALRPPLAQERLHRATDGEVWLTLRHRWSDGTTHLRLDPLERLAVLTPRPRVNLVLYYGVLAPRALWREAIVPRTASGGDVREEVAPEDRDASGATPSMAGAYQWAELMRRTFGVDVLACPGCGGRLRLVALIEHRR